MKTKDRKAKCENEDKETVRVTPRKSRRVAVSPEIKHETICKCGNIINITDCYNVGRKAEKGILKQVNNPLKPKGKGSPVETNPHELEASSPEILDKAVEESLRIVYPNTLYPMKYASKYIKLAIIIALKKGMEIANKQKVPVNILGLETKLKYAQQQARADLIKEIEKLSMVLHCSSKEHTPRRILHEKDWQRIKEKVIE